MKKRSNSKGLAHIPIIVIGAIIVLVVIIIASGSLNINFDISKNNQDGAEQSTEVSTTPKPNNTFQESGISLEYPGDWTQSPTPAGFIAVFSAPQENASDDYNENVNIKSVDISSQPNVSLQELSDLWFSQTQANYAPGDFNLIKRNSTTLSGFAAEQFVYSVNDSGNDSQGMTVITINNSSTTIVSYIAKKITFDTYLEGANTILSSLTLE